MTTATPENQELESVRRMSRDIARSAQTITNEEAKFLVQSYYEMQDRRKASDQRANALTKQAKPNAVVEWLADQDRILEQQLSRALDQYTGSQPLGIWAREQVGIGPVTTAGLMAYVNFDRAKTAGSVWRYAGLDPTNIWYGREKATALVNEIVGKNTYATVEQLTQLSLISNRSVEAIRRNVAAIAHFKNVEEEDNSEAVTPEGEVRRTLLINYFSRKPWNANLKLLCWKIGDSFCKTHNNPNSFYGPIYRDRKALEVVRNANGEYAPLAEQALKERNIQSTELRRTYEAGKLPDGRIELRARRYAVKLFLSHYFEVGYRLHHKQAPPAPFVISQMGHIDYIPPPHLDVIDLAPWW